MRTALSMLGLVSMFCTQIHSTDLVKYTGESSTDPNTYFNVSGEIIGIPTADIAKDEGLLNDLVFSNNDADHNLLRDKNGYIILSILRPVFEVIKCFLIYNDIPNTIDEFFLRQASEFFRNPNLSRLIKGRLSKTNSKEYSIITRERMSPVCPICATKIEKANNLGHSCTTFLNHLLEKHCNAYEMVENQIISEQNNWWR